MFIFNLWSEKYKNSPIPNLLRIIGCVLSVIVCLLFSTRVFGVMDDFRLIPIIIGGLYFGYGPLLTFVSLLLRVLFYDFDSSFWSVLPLYIILAIFLQITHGWFQKQNSRHRLSFALLTAITMNILISVGLLISGHSIDGLKAMIITTIIQTIGLFIIAYFIEEIKQNKFYREQLFRAQKIELVSHMSAAISHEVRNPLTSVSGFLQLALEDSAIHDQTREYITVALTELKAAENVIKDYLTVAQPCDHTIEKFDPTKELNQIIKSLQPIANMNSVEVNILNNDLCYILGDRNRFKQCFLNIMKNSVEAMTNGGSLNVSTCFLNSHVNIKISDTGIGMTEDQINRLGEPYFSTKGKKGTGLGLMVSFSIIRELKGTIQINSVLGKGTEFSVSFPALRNL